MTQDSRHISHHASNGSRATTLDKKREIIWNTSRKKESAKNYQVRPIWQIQLGQSILHRGLLASDSMPASLSERLPLFSILLYRPHSTPEAGLQWAEKEAPNLEKAECESRVHTQMRGSTGMEATKAVTMMCEREHRYGDSKGRGSQTRPCLHRREGRPEWLKGS